MLVGFCPLDFRRPSYARPRGARQNVAVKSDSARTANARPLYASHADAYDKLIAGETDPWVAEIREIRLEGTLLDAGCGTGRYAAALSGAGYDVSLVDASSALLSIASERCPTAPAHLADVCTLDLGRNFDIITCRGVLNDLLGDEDRRAAVVRMTAHLAEGGVLVLDVRARTATSLREPTTVTRTAILDSGAEVRFRSESAWCDPHLLISETVEFSPPGQPTEVERYEFAMRPWDETELRRTLGEAGLLDVEVTAATHRPTTDRWFVVARR